MLKITFTFIVLLLESSALCLFPTLIRGSNYARKGAFLTTRHMANGGDSANVHTDKSTIAADDTAAKPLHNNRKNTELKENHENSKSKKPKEADFTDYTSVDAFRPTRSTKVETERRYDLPWSEMQQWALRDQLSKFTVQVPAVFGGKETIRVFTLWRTMVEEVPELSGYPLSFLLDRQAELMERNETNIRTTLEILPYLDEYEFEPNGGLVGSVYGVRGVADGTRIRTTSVGEVKTTIPKGFVCTEDGTVIYELGSPAGDTYSLDGTSKIEKFSKISKAAQFRTSISRVSNPFDEDPILDSDLIRLGGLTAILLGGALAVETLSHHLTINVFWV